MHILVFVDAFSPTRGNCIQRILEYSFCHILTNRQSNINYQQSTEGLNETIANKLLRATLFFSNTLLILL